MLLSILFLLPITAGLTSYVILQVQAASDFGPQNNGYAQPENHGLLVENLQKALVTVDCRGINGSGFAFELDTVDIENGYEFSAQNFKNSESRIITNAHVVQDCMDNGIVSFISAEGKMHRGEIEIFDQKNDLALLKSPILIKGISGVYWTPRPGYWVMGLGSPHKFAGSVTFGNIINFDKNSIFHTASLSPGSSGGPLVDNEGYLFGVNTGAKPIGQNFNISVSLNAFCDAIVKCPEGTYWKE